MPIIGAIVGATGCGKTEFAIEMAKKMNAEILCMDSRQVFKGFRIGTAQPTFEERQTVPHNLVDFLSPEQSYNAAAFANDVKKIIAQKPNVNFLLAGGTGLYMQALCKGLNQLPPSDPAIRERLKIYYNAHPQELYANALKAKPGIEGKIMPRDAQRLLRVLELKEQGMLEKTDEGRVGGIGDIPSMFLDIPRDELYKRINQRVISMLKNGWVEEVEELSKIVPVKIKSVGAVASANSSLEVAGGQESFKESGLRLGTDIIAPAWQSLGYLEIKNALEIGKNPLLLADEIAIKTRHYAKRQITWFKNQPQSLA